MKAVYVQEGKSLDYKNGSGTDILAGDVVIMGSRAGVAGTDIPVGLTGSIHIEGVFKIPKKAAEAITAGAVVFYSEDGLTAVSAEKAAQVTVGYAVAAAAESDATVMVKLLG